MPIFLGQLLWDSCLKGQCTDLDFVCKDQEVIKAHQAIIAHRIPVFKEILKDSSADDNVIVIIPDQSANELKSQLLKFYHQGVNQSHMQSTARIFPCQNCGKMFKSKKQLQTHKLSHHEEKWNFKCDICQRKFINTRSLNNHKAKDHGNRFKCHICSKSYSSDANLLIHTKNIHGRNSFKCDICGQTFASKSYLQIHLKKHRKEGPDFKVKSCDFCNKILKGRYHYEHVKLHAPESWKHQCRFCQTKFQSKSKRIDHEAANHTHERPYRCELCTKAFQTSARKASHKKLCKVTQKFHPPNDLQESKNLNYGQSSNIRMLPSVLPHSNDSNARK